MNLKTKILAGYGAALALVVLVCSWGAVNLQRLGKASDAILQENYRSILAAENMIDALERQDSATLLILLGDESMGIEQFRKSEVTFLQWLGRAQDNVTIPGERKILLALSESYENYLIAFDQLQQQELTETSVTNYYDETVFPAFQQVRENSTQLRELNQATMLAASETAQSISHQAIASMIIIGGGAAGIGLGFSLLLSDRIIRPLKEMMKATEQIAEGNYNVAIAVKSQDELGNLGTAINLMSQKLKAFHDLNVGKVILEKQRSEAIIQSITDGLVVVNADLEITAINPIAASILGVSPQRALNHHFLAVFNHQELYEKIQTTAQNYHPLPETDEDSILTIVQNQETKYYQFSITPVITENKQIWGVILLLQDITKLKELDQLKSDFVATASHELRTPLTGISMSVNLLLETIPEKLSEPEKELLEAASADVERLRILVNDLLDLSKIESGRIEMELGTVEASFLLKKAISLLRIQAQEKEIQLTQHCPEDSLLVNVDPNKIVWVLTNLIANAIRYTDTGGKIELIAEQRGNWVEISVADNGAGIPWEYQAKIFDKFVQVQTEKDIGGSGLGLAICQEVVNAHGGRIWVDSTPGEGSTFTFTVPMVKSLPE
ncbi:HAMP domain-containing sensor histidine kinase [Oscillatoria salina]|uniref:HAMP domain-containing sensor histidine kinase n=1 Tax=Oscillatoria salina TaxID=331517 RepID=UPI0013B916F6|nr:ATP-binding protein [Oscillatoria salina]MBZ8182415.1 HAMP domain-containing protein [Oscillatoria salina IIICB1]NET90923.1 HAMP domain-containing protein [Kamptonema sp. SIO1D9]